MDIVGKNILITGAARGIGQACAQLFVAAGANVLVADRSDCAGTVALCEGQRGSVASAVLDVTVPDTARAAVDATIANFGSIDGLLNNAALYGALKGGRFEEIAEADWDAAMAVNVKGIWNCCKAAVPHMRKAGGGSVVNIASMAATYGTPYMLHYTTSKAAVIGLTRGLARELGRDNIRVNAVAPSAVVTEGTKEFFAQRTDKALDAVKAIQAIQSNLMPEDLAGAIAWLMSDTSRFVTGQTISVDGGTVMH